MVDEPERRRYQTRNVLLVAGLIIVLLAGVMFAFLL